MDVETVRLSRVGLTIVLLSFLAGSVFAQKVDARQPPMEKKNYAAPRYRIGLKYRTVEGDPTLVVNISIDPHHFNREEIIALSRKLNEDFHNENRLVVIFFSNYESSKHTVFNQESSTFKRDFTAMRGSYHLDRSRGEEYVSFSPKANEPKNEIKIDLKK